MILELQTKIPLQPRSSNKIDYDSRILSIGSCFAENIGEKLAYYKFRNAINPFGILFHPKAIEKLVLRAIEGEAYGEEDIFHQNERWHCFDAHSKLSNTSKNDLLQELNSALELTTRTLQEASHIIITLGTAWVYRHLERDSIVANCHKVPQKIFSKILLSVSDIKSSLQNIEKEVRRINPDVQFIYTVSPVRHLKDGFIENTQSKSHLIAAVHKSLNSSSNYFPSYEIMMDELRDYRFYDEDMIHPNATAVDYIWQGFKSVWINLGTFKTMKDVETVQKGMHHRPFNPKSSEHKRFILQIEEKKKNLGIKFPHIKF